MSVWRPADVTETAISWRISLEKLNGSLSSLVLTRQSLPELTRSNEQIKSIKKGGYIIRDCNKIDAIIVSSGSEVHLMC